MSAELVDMAKCQQKPPCDKTPAYRVFWPGKDPMIMCSDHADKARAIGSVIGCPIHMEPIIFGNGGPDEH